MSVRDEFKVHRLDEAGLAKAGELGHAFSDCLDRVEALLKTDRPLVGPKAGESGRCLALVRTKLQEASFFAKRALAVRVGTP